MKQGNTTSTCGSIGRLLSKSVKAHQAEALMQWNATTRARSHSRLPPRLPPLQAVDIDHDDRRIP